MNSPQTQHTNSHSNSHESFGGFRGIITKLLSEAFYLEDEYLEPEIQNPDSSLIVPDPTEDYEVRHDQINIIQQFLKLRT